MVPAHKTQTQWPLIVVLLAGLNLLPELVLQVADAGLIGSTRWRITAYSNAAVWPGLLQTWRPHFPGQAGLMFLTYGFVHTGLWHLAVNMIALIALAQRSLQHLSQRAFLLLYLTALVGGGLAYVALSSSLRPMVGASGAVYGLAAAWIYWDMRDARKMAEVVPWRTYAYLAALLSANFLSWWSLGGELAWQTHLGGAVAARICVWQLDRSGHATQSTPEKSSDPW